MESVSDDNVDAESSNSVEEVEIQNDSTAHFDGHSDSVLCITSHPTQSTIIATGGLDHVGYIFEIPHLPSSDLRDEFLLNAMPVERKSINALYKLEGHTDTVNAITFTLPNGEYVVTGGLDGKLRVWRRCSAGEPGWVFLAESHEVDEINWLSACPSTYHCNVIAFGASDGSVWVYAIDITEELTPLTIVDVFNLHTGSCTAGTWTTDGTLLCTVDDHGSFYVWDVWRYAEMARLILPECRNVVGITNSDEQFRVDGGLFSIAVPPKGDFAAVGGAEGQIRIVGLPHLGTEFQSSTKETTKNQGPRHSQGGKKQNGRKVEASTRKAGQVLNSLQIQTESVESLSFSTSEHFMLAAGSVDSSIAIFDTKNYALRKFIRDAHKGEAVIKVEFVKGGGNSTWLLTSCGNDGVVRKWNTRGDGTAQSNGLVREWRGHGGGLEGGVMGFVQSKDGDRIVTAGDDGISLVFNT